MRLRFVVAPLLVLAAPLGAQAAPSLTVKATTPAECLKAVNDWRMAQLTTARPNIPPTMTQEERAAASAKFSATYSAISNEAQRAGRKCADQFDVEAMPSSQLVDLAALYAFVGDTAKRWRATDRAIAATDLTPRQRGTAMQQAMAREVARANARDEDGKWQPVFAMNEAAERVVAQIDALPDSLSDIKISAHESMLGRYEYLDVAEGLRKHATAIIALAKSAGKPERTVEAYLSLARSQADVLHPDSALMILDAAEKELGKSRTERAFSEFRARYALIGTKAAPITGKWWLNTAAKPVSIQPGNGRVTIVEFTAHWCVPCKNSYPGMRGLAERFKGQPYDAVMVTSLYGFLGDRRNLTPEQEVEADSVYFGKDHHLPYKVAVNASSDRAVDEAYRVGGIPQIAIVDKKGVIRQIVTGWDHGNSARFSKLIEQLIAEK